MGKAQSIKKLEWLGQGVGCRLSVWRMGSADDGMG
jgi:hypothetical protein